MFRPEVESRMLTYKANAFSIKLFRTTTGRHIHSGNLSVKIFSLSRKQFNKRNLSNETPLNNGMQICAIISCSQIGVVSYTENIFSTESKNIQVELKTKSLIYKLLLLNISTSNHF